MEKTTDVIPRIRQVLYTTFALMPIVGVVTGDLCYATDTLSLYRWSGATWQIISAPSTSPSYALYIPFTVGLGTPTVWPTDVANGVMGYKLDAAAEAAKGCLEIPEEFTTLVKATIKVQCDGGGTMDWTFSTAFCDTGEAPNTHTDSVTENGKAVATNTFAELDVSAAFTGVLKGDFFSFVLTLDALAGGMANCRTGGLLINYT